MSNDVGGKLEILFFIFCFYGGFYLLVSIFSAITRWNENRIEKINDEMSNQIWEKYGVEYLIKESNLLFNMINYQIKTEESSHDYSYKYYQQKHPLLLGKCPKCDEGNLRKIYGKFGEFIGCSKYPNCKYTKNMYKATIEHKAKIKSEYKIYIQGEKNDINKDFVNSFKYAYEQL